MTRPDFALSLMPEQAWLQAALPLIEENDIDAIEWSFDWAWKGGEIPAWAFELLDHFSAADKLYGHGVHYSILSVECDQHEHWLEKLRAECDCRRYRHLSEHFGLMRAGNFHRGAPLPVPYDPALAELAADRLAVIGSIAACPVGLENLALAFSREDVCSHAAFIGEILAPVNGFYLLDLHNLYCQSVNFGIALQDLFASFPADRIAELHVSGGSWSESIVEGAKRTIRRDTHDDAVPEEIFALLPTILPLIPNLRVLTFEQLSSSLTTPASRERFLEDARRVRGLLKDTYLESR